MAIKQGVERAGDGVNIVIPMGGLGTRFQRAGYRFPKPMINIAGRPMITWVLDNLRIDSERDKVFIALSGRVDKEFRISDLLRKSFPRLKFQFVHLGFTTRGAAETLFVILSHMSAQDRLRKTISLDCDTIYFSDVISMFRKVPSGMSACFYFEDREATGRYSYISLNIAGELTDVREKVAISSHANTGAYGFASGDLLMRYASTVMDEALIDQGELYTSCVLHRMLKEAETIKGVHIADFACVGTPDELVNFISLLRKRPYLMKKLRFCFDIDRTLLIRGETGIYTTVERNTEIVRDLHSLGHTIILFCSGDILAKVSQYPAEEKNIIDILRQHNVPFDEVYTSKPDADAFVDDLAVHSSFDTEHEIGWFSKAEPDMLPKTATISETRLPLGDVASNGSRQVFAPKTKLKSENIDDLSDEEINLTRLLLSGTLTGHTLCSAIDCVLNAQVKTSSSSASLSVEKSPEEDVQSAPAHVPRVALEALLNEKKIIFRHAGLLNLFNRLQHSLQSSKIRKTCIPLNQCSIFDIITVAQDGSLAYDDDENEVDADYAYRACQAAEILFCLTSFYHQLHNADVLKPSIRLRQVAKDYLQENFPEVYFKDVKLLVAFLLVNAASVSDDLMRGAALEIQTFL